MQLTLFYFNFELGCSHIHTVHFVRLGILDSSELKSVIILKNFHDSAISHQVYYIKLYYYSYI